MVGVTYQNKEFPAVCVGQKILDWKTSLATSHFNRVGLVQD